MSDATQLSATMSVPCPRVGRWDGMRVYVWGELVPGKCPDCGVLFTWKYGYPTLRLEDCCTDDRRNALASI